MTEIRAVNPQARLLHTDDAGTIFATAPLVRQAAFENQRRDLALDLLFGCVDHQHPLWSYLRASGATTRKTASHATIDVSTTQPPKGSAPKA